jgi:predicted phage terminase large subunit-like protein
VLALAPPVETTPNIFFAPDDELLRSLAERSLRRYVVQAWHVAEPSTPYVSGWHIDCICEHLEAASRGELRNLIINIPPRHTKSLIVSVLWPTWLWTTRPEMRLLYTSYAESLAIRDSLKSRRVLQSQWYQQRWGARFQITSDQNTKGRYDNDKTGYRLASSVGGATTGEGGGVLCVDDPNNVVEAESVAVRDRTNHWWDEAMSTRADNEGTVIRVIVAQRVHEDDLSGHLLNTQPGVYHHLALPAEYAPRVFPCAKTPEPYHAGDPEPHDCPIYCDPRTKAGELLNPGRFPVEALQRLQLALGPYAASGQLQQNPVPRKGELFSAEWFRPLPSTIDMPDPRGQTLRQSLRTYLYWDLAYSERVTADWTAACLLGVDTAEAHYLLGAWRERVAERNLAESMAQYIAITRPSLVGVEAGIFARQSSVRDLVRQVVRLLSIRGVAATLVLVKADTDKVSRAQLPAGRAKLGFTYADKAAPWWDGFERELLAFPNGQHDDQVDAYSGATLLAIEKHGLAVLPGPEVPQPRQEYALGPDKTDDGWDPFEGGDLVPPERIYRLLG